MAGLDKIAERQLEIGAAGWFRPDAESPAGNQIVVRAGFGYRGAFSVEDQFTGGDQTTAGFASVTGPGLKRFDMVYIDLSGVVQISQGAEVATATANFNGGPGASAGPPMPQGSPVAYVLIDEVGAVIVATTDIFQINGFLRLSRDLSGYLVDKGLLGGVPAGLDDVVTALFAVDTRIVPVTGVTEPNSGGSSTQAGFVTLAVLNYVTLLNQANDEVLHTSGALMYGRLTEVAGVWTLSYYYTDAAGAEQTMDPAVDATVAPTDLRLVGTPRVFSSHDPGRPLFQSSVARLSDTVVGDIPTATTAVQGKALKANNPNTQPVVPQIGSLAEIQNIGIELAGGPWNTLNFPNGGIVDGGGGVANAVNLVPTGSPTQEGKLQTVIDGVTAVAGRVPAFPDARIGAVKGRANAGAVTGFEQILRLIAGTGVTVGLVQAAGEQQFTIASTVGILQSFYANNASAMSFNTGALGFTPIACIVISSNGLGISVGLAVGIAAGSQGSLNFLIGLGNSIVATKVVSGFGAGDWTVTQFTAAGVIASGTTATVTSVLVIGQ